MKTEKKTVIFDLDGTLADISHRRHYIEGKKKDWKNFHKAVDKDLPNKPIIDCLNAMRVAGYAIYIYTGRVDYTKDKTIAWLNRYGINYEKLRMRPANNRIGDEELKRNWLKWDFGKTYKDDIVCVFDDRDKVVKMWRQMGLTCCQVAPGRF